MSHIDTDSKLYEEITAPGMNMTAILPTASTLFAIPRGLVRVGDVALLTMTLPLRIGEEERTRGTRSPERPGHI